ncbi:MAG: FHA domain-containing protein [Deltaproteobacteria bacterium]|nr:FHA domain-containing protein [Deltaproteobacteria bacterium]
MGRCVQCGSELAVGAAFCIRCGTPIGGRDGAGEARKTVGEDGMFGGPRPVEVRQVSANPPPRSALSEPPAYPQPPPSADGARKTQLDEGGGFGGGGGFGVGAAGHGAPANPQPGGARRTQLDEGDGFGAPALPTRPVVMAHAAGSGASHAAGGRRTVLDEGPGPASDATQARAANPGGAGAMPGNVRSSGVVAASGPRVVGWLVTFDHDASGTHFVLRAGKNSIGSGRDNAIALFMDRKVSERHATILWRDGKCAVKDETSSNGTFVNGEDVGIGESARLPSGASLRVGNTTFAVFLLDPAVCSHLWPASFPAA